MTLKPQPDAVAESLPENSMSVDGCEFPWRRPRDRASDSHADDEGGNDDSGAPTHRGGVSSAPPPGATDRGAVTSNIDEEHRSEEESGNEYDDDYSEDDEIMSLCSHSDDEEDIDGEEFEPTVLYLFSGPLRPPDDMASVGEDIGIKVASYDLEISAEHDLLDDARFNEVAKDIENGMYIGGIAAPPCSTFSPL